MSNPKDLAFSILTGLEERVERVCHPSARYRALWLVGLPRMGKSKLSRDVCIRNDWVYLNYTLDQGYLDAVSGCENRYTPTDFLYVIHQICENGGKPILVVDEIEPLLALWTRKQQDRFFELASFDTTWACGVVIVTRLRRAPQLKGLVPNLNHIFELNDEYRSVR